MSAPMALASETGSLTWTTNSIPDLSGKTFIVTGGNSGVGWETSKHLALKGAHVIIATHVYTPGDSTSPADEIGGPEAVQKIKDLQPEAQVEFMPLDLASFRSIHEFVEGVKAKLHSLHCLINNAGLSTPPDATTKEGFEVQMGVNYLGHVYLSNLLLPLLKASAPSRLVWVASPDETIAEPDWSNIRSTLTSMATVSQGYSCSKLFNIMYSMELNDRLKGSGVESFMCHPGLARTDIFRKADHSKLKSVVTDWAQWISGQSAESGAHALLYTATAPELEGHGGTYYGAYYKGPWTPNLFNTSTRTPGNPDAHDAAKRRQLYEETQKVVAEAEAAAAGASGQQAASKEAQAAAVDAPAGVAV